MEDSRDVFDNSALKRLLLFIYLVPIFGVVPAIWTLSRRDNNPRKSVVDRRQQREASRVAVMMGLAWLIGTLGLTSGITLANAEHAQGMGMSLLLLSSLLTSGYFLSNLWLMVRVWQRQSLHIPGLNRLRKYLP